MYLIFIKIIFSLISLAEGDLAVTIALIAVIITFFGVLLSDRRTKKSNELTLIEIKHRLRPWIKITDVFPTSAFLTDGSIATWEQFTNNTDNHIDLLTNVQYTSKIENIGSLPAMAIKIKTLGGIEEIKKGDVEKDGVKGIILPLMPNETFTNRYDLSIKEFKDRKNNPHYYGIYIEYYVEDEKNSVEKIWEITDTNVLNVSYSIK